MNLTAEITNKPVILVFAGTYLPGYRAGGPIRSIANIVEALADEFDFRIITLDHDLGEKRRYAGVQSDVWTQVGKAQVMYLSRRGQMPYRIWRLVRATTYDVIYLNSFFARRFSMFPYALWRLRLVKQTPLILAPRGEFSPGALGLKRRVKQAYISVSRWFRTYQNGLLLWHASTALEAQDIRRVVMNDPSIAPPLGDTAPAVNRERGFGSAEIAVDLPGHARVPASLKLKRPGELKAVFVSRVSRKKNLDYALRALKGIKGDVTFDICGPIEDAAFWDECKVLIGKLPPNTKVNYLGEVPHEDIARVFSEHDVFLFATRGENYGHVICEALTAGCPVVISDQTPWRNLQSLGVGWDLPLEDIGAFQSAIQQCIDMGTEEFAAFSQRTLAYGIERSTDKEAIEQNRRLFRRACEMANPAQRGNAPS